MEKPENACLPLATTASVKIDNNSKHTNEKTFPPKESCQYTYHVVQR